MPFTAPEREEREERLIRIHAALNDTTARKRHKSEKRGYCRACDFVGKLRRINPAFCRECVDSALRRPYRADFANAAAPRSTERYRHVRRRALPATAETSNSGTTAGQALHAVKRERDVDPEILRQQELTDERLGLVMELVPPSEDQPDSEIVHRLVRAGVPSQINEAQSGSAAMSN